MKQYKRFMFFQIEAYYPSGGLSDCDESFDTLEEALNYMKLKNYHAYECELFDRVQGVEILLEDSDAKG